MGLRRPLERERIYTVVHIVRIALSTHVTEFTNDDELTMASESSATPPIRDCARPSLLTQVLNIIIYLDMDL